MFRIGAEQTRSLMIWFLVLAAGSLVALVSALLISVRHATRGLPQLSRAATAVAEGDLEVPFRATGFGEVHSLGIAFEAMLTNLRTSFGRIRQLAFYDPVTGLSNREKVRIDGAARRARPRRARRLPVHGPQPLQGHQRHLRPQGR